MIKSNSPDLTFNRYKDAIPTDNTFYNLSKAVEVVGNVTKTLITAKEGVSYWVKGVTIIGEGSGGEIRINGEIGAVDTLLLPLYMSVQSRGTTSGALNLKLDENTPITFVTSGRATNKTFVGVSYIEVADTMTLGFVALFDNLGEPMYSSDGKQLYVKAE